MQGILPYFTDPAVNSSAAGWFGHSFGGMLTAMAAGYVLEPDSKLLTKLMGIGNALCMPNFVMASTSGSCKSPFTRHSPLRL
jgi:hypothetical protein